jgi:hypothetical protein
MRDTFGVSDREKNGEGRCLGGRLKQRLDSGLSSLERRFIYTPDSDTRRRLSALKTLIPIIFFYMACKCPKL